jgi:hypothetical protein
MSELKLRLVPTEKTARTYKTARTNKTEIFRGLVRRGFDGIGLSRVAQDTGVDQDFCLSSLRFKIISLRLS